MYDARLMRSPVFSRAGTPNQLTMIPEPMAKRAGALAAVSSPPIRPPVAPPIRMVSIATVILEAGSPTSIDALICLDSRYAKLVSELRQVLSSDQLQAVWTRFGKETLLGLLAQDCTGSPITEACYVATSIHDCRLTVSVGDQPYTYACKGHRDYQIKGKYDAYDNLRSGVVEIYTIHNGKRVLCQQQEGNHRWFSEIGSSGLTDGKQIFYRSNGKISAQAEGLYRLIDATGNVELIDGKKTAYLDDGTPLCTTTGRYGWIPQANGGQGCMELVTGAKAFYNQAGILTLTEDGVFQWNPTTGEMDLVDGKQAIYPQNGKLSIQLDGRFGLVSDVTQVSIVDGKKTFYREDGTVSRAEKGVFRWIAKSNNGQGSLQLLAGKRIIYTEEGGLDSSDEGMFQWNETTGYMQLANGKQTIYTENGKLLAQTEGEYTLVAAARRMLLTDGTQTVYRDDETILDVTTGVYTWIPQSNGGQGGMWLIAGTRELYNEAGVLDRTEEGSFQWNPATNNIQLAMLPYIGPLLLDMLLLWVVLDARHS